MASVQIDRELPPRARVRAEPGEYVVELDVPDFAERELRVEVLGRRVSVRGERAERPEGGRLDETFRLPADAAGCRVRALYRNGTLELHAPRRSREPRRVPIEHAAYRVNADAEPC